MQRGECKTTEGGGSEDQRLIARLFVLPTVLNPRKTPDLGGPHGAGFGSAIPLDSLGVSDAIHSEDQRVETAASRKWEAIAAVFCGREERPFQSRLATAADRAAPHEIEGE